MVQKGAIGTSRTEEAYRYFRQCQAVSALSARAVHRVGLLAISDPQGSVTRLDLLDSASVA